jgi:adenosine deaminase
MNTTEIKNIPKIELHTHLDCSLSLKTYEKLIKESPKYNNNYMVKEKYNSLVDYFSYVNKIVNIMQNEKNIRIVSKDFFEQLLEDNVKYAEVRFAPHIHLDEGLKVEEVVEIVIDEKRNFELNNNIKINLILCTLRHFDEKKAMETVKLVEKYRDNDVVALDIAGDEIAVGLEPNIKAFKYAFDKDINVTTHAGEVGPYENIIESIDLLGSKRIGHGIKSIESKNLIHKLIEDNVHLEICPTSNFKTSSIKSYNNHPIDKIFKSGVSLSINTDGRVLFDISLNREYENLINTFDWDIEDLIKCNVEAVKHSFIENSYKKELLEKLKKFRPVQIESLENT